MLRDLEVTPGWGWRGLRRLTQVIAIVAVLVSPLLGGWQRLDRTRMATWQRGGSELPADLAERLPLGEAARRAHRTNRLLGGGLGVEAVGIPAADPVAGTFALLRAGTTPRALLAVGLPMLLALLAGRVFCGWLCPFGILARGLGRILDRLRWPHFRIPESRPIRWLVLAVALGAGLVGSHALLYMSLPHLLVQQTIYRAWLLGGGSAILGVLLGLLIAATLFGPTTYCAAVCPTGALLGGLGRRRAVRLHIAKVQDCGLHCMQCDRACWLQLHPATGDPGPDCDLCARCVGACPRSNLRVGLGQGPLKLALKKAALPKAIGRAAIALALTLPLAAEAGDQPRLVLRGELERGGVTVAISVVDLAGVRLDADSAEAQSGIELTVFVARGIRGPADERGRLPSREVYDGPLEVRIKTGRGDSVRSLRLTAPNSPRSAPRRTLYRWQALEDEADSKFESKLGTGDVVELKPIAGWLEEPVTWRIPEPDLNRTAWVMVRAVLAASLGFSGLLSLALAARPKRKARDPRAGAGAGTRKRTRFEEGEKMRMAADNSGARRALASTMIVATALLGACGGPRAENLRSVEVSTRAIATGKVLFGTCAACHGRDAQGRIGVGPRIASESYLAAASDAFLLETIREGRAGTTMVGWKDRFNDGQIEGLVAYLRSLHDVEPAELDESPLRGDAANGAEIFRSICSGCHGRAGAGYQETANGTGIGRRAFLDTASNGFLRYVVTHGKSQTAMRGFSEQSKSAVANLSRQEIDDTITYLRESSW